MGMDEIGVDEMIAACLERLIECGPVDDVAQLRSMLPDSNAEARQFVLVELPTIEKVAPLCSRLELAEFSQAAHAYQSRGPPAMAL